MERKKSKMICPKCGDEMNHHADKLVYSAGADDSSRPNADFGVVIEETHECPACRAIESRRADWAPTAWSPHEPGSRLVRNKQKPD
jgi:hypothetical protein